ncbi:MAG: nitroreductase [candidate division Zixibacteria bacterium]|nr:nitroreductase [candidate division Zixibacteria bacterium]
MERPASTEYPITDVMARRWSGRDVDPNRPVSEEQLMTLLEAARWAPSSFNEQPWRYLIFDQSDPDARSKAHDCLAEGNAWAKNAPVLMLSVAKETFTKNGKPNRHHAHDVGAASISMALQAADMGLMVHQMAGFDATKAKAAFDIPDGYTPVAMIAVAYQLPDDALSEEQRDKYSKPRSRKPVSEIASRGRWDSTLS